MPVINNRIWICLRCDTQVFRARWRGEVVAAKLVPFMSLVAQNHSMSVSLVSAAVGAPDAAAAAGGTDSSQLSNMRLGVQFSSASLRAIKLEIRVLSQLSHPHIVAFKGACMAPPHICILEEVRQGEQSKHPAAIGLVTTAGYGRRGPVVACIPDQCTYLIQQVCLFDHQISMRLPIARPGHAVHASLHDESSQPVLHPLAVDALVRVR